MTLDQNYPNPFVEFTRIEYTLNRTSPVSIDIYAIDGKLIRRLVDTVQPKGVHVAVWDATNDRGASVPAGVYVGRVTGKDVVRSFELVVMR